jgi:hypothetical protein
MKACSCGNTEFITTQMVQMLIVADTGNNWVKDIKIGPAKKPSGPYTCTECGKVYCSVLVLPDLPQSVEFIKDK